MKTITVEVSDSGEVKIDAVGFKGSACEKATAEIEKALGTPGKRTRKSDFWQAQQQGQKVGQS